ncbi:MAG TPA: gliding motility-associated C-terminal domain-containing protein, partial [Chitinophagales bacterium]|nr:gliding motility-associated C-terminal domain-containing protein [Chitinophagales bacterium]
YYVIVTDSNSCQKRDSITIQEPAAITVQKQVTNVLCHGGTTGSVNLTVNGGTPGYTFNWSNGATTQNISGVGAGTYYVTVTDTHNCSVLDSATVSEPTAMVLNGTAVDVACAGGHSGSVAITVNGGVFPYSYAWSNGATTQNINGLSGGNYTVTVTDANGCTTTASFTINEPTPITTSISGTDVTCHGAANGSATVTASGGMPPYTYLWNTFQSTQTIDSISGGHYFVIVTDANGCSVHDSIVIFEPTAIVTHTTATNTTCNGNTDGSVTLTVSGGTPGYTYSWSNSATTQNLTGVGAGTYYVTVTDNNGCTTVDSATVTEPALLVATGIVENVHCAGGSDGRIDLTVTGGTYPYVYAWSNSQTTQNATNLTAGGYSVTVTDAHGCSATLSFTVTEPTPIQTSVTGTDVTCHGNSNGTASLTVSGGTPPYTFLWSNFQITQNITGLSGGTYFVIVTDSNGCTKRDSVFIFEPTPLLVTDSSSNISCFNANDGTITIFPIGGQPPYSYAWSNGATTQNVTGLAGGSYCVTVTDQSGCSATACATIVNPPILVTNFVVHNTICFGDSNGYIDVIQSGGTPNYTFVWSTGATTQDIDSLAAGTYVITVTDSRGCINVDSAMVQQPAALYTSGVIKNVTCHGYNDGAVIITAYGGTLPYSYLWSPVGVSTQNLYDVGGGNYFVSVTDANGCAVQSLYIVVDPPLLTDTIVHTDVSCYGGSNGTAAIIPSGGTGSATAAYSYLWNDFSIDSNRTGLMAGEHFVLLTDSNGCRKWDSVKIDQPTQIQITGLVNDAVCYNSATGAININVTGGVPSYTFDWSSGATSQNLNTLIVGTYTVTVTDQNNCTATSDFVVNQPPQMFVDILTVKPTCFGGNNGSMSAVATMGTPPYTYEWSTNPTQTSPSASDLEAGDYTVTVTDSHSCTVTVTKTLDQPDSIAISTTGAIARCFNTPSTPIVVNVSGGTSPYVYELNGMLQANDTFAGLLPGNYTVLVTDRNGCDGSYGFHIASPSQMSVTLSTTDNIILTGMTTQLVATATSDTDIIHYIWSPIVLDGYDVFDYSACGDSSNCNNPSVRPPFTTTFMVTVMNADSCFASDTVTIYVDNQPVTFIPTAFTPNGDGLNDRFEFDVLGANTIEISIYDRWGQKVYYNPAQPNGQSGSNGWDGTSSGKLDPAGTYVYQMKITYFDGTTKDKAGTITLMR